MAEKLTKQQEAAIKNRGGNLLVSAAAGSGKTKVLVDRLLSYVNDPVQPADVDEFLIITYTKAAAAELRGKIAAKISEVVAMQPNNLHLQRQIQRLYLTKISTVHAFCSDLLREYSYLLDVPCDFRVAEETECLELQLRIIDQLLDDAYENDNDPDFLAFADSQGLGRNDTQIPDLIVKVYNSARCHLQPDKWLNQCERDASVSDLSDVSETIWGHYLIGDLHQYLDLQISAFKKCIQLASHEAGMDKPAALLADTLSQFERLRETDSWDLIRERLNISYGKLYFPKNCENTILIEQIKAVRNSCKKGIEKRAKRFSDCSQQVLTDLRKTSSSVRGLIQFVKRFTSAYAKQKYSRHILDFSDLEHKALDLLLGKDRQAATSLAREVGKRYREVMVDEYQDSNSVQDAIFKAITTGRNNCFMVGDVKQSIYQFRLADPSIFLEKYNQYLPAETAENGQGRKIFLSSNFRSCSAVIDAVNDIFSTCMSKQVGGLVYGNEESLKEGIPHIPLCEPEIELHTITVQNDTYAEEAAFTAKRIKELLDGKHYIRDGERARAIELDDIVILLRSPGSVGNEFYAALELLGIPCSAGDGEDLLQTEEITTLHALLKVIHNPLQDVPLTAVLMSRVFSFTADEMAELRSEDKGANIYNLLQQSSMPKAQSFLSLLSRLRSAARRMKLPEFLEYVLTVTKLDHVFAALPHGEQCLENLQSFFQIAVSYDQSGGFDLSRFLDYLLSLTDHGLSVSAEENKSGAVRIMSIHKSKGLEFPVVFVCGLSRSFNRESSRAQVLCDRDLGLGLSCVDVDNRIRYPSVIKSAISTKIVNDSLSEEMRVLYVALTRAKDRLIMTYAVPNLCSDLSEIALRLDVSPVQLLTADADCPGVWILITALRHAEAHCLIDLAGYSPEIKVSDTTWLITTSDGDSKIKPISAGDDSVFTLQQEKLTELVELIDFQYPYQSATVAPSKLTATQLKGRIKDKEIAEYSQQTKINSRNWRKPSFVEQTFDGRTYGNAIHTVLQYIRFSCCTSLESISKEIDRLEREGYISADCAAVVERERISAFFASELGFRLINSKKVLREFKFSILNDAGDYFPDISSEKILLQGVVDCALLEDDGITIIDFKTDHVSESNIESVTAKYQIQVNAYAKALERIYQCPVKEKLIYYFSLNRLVKL